MAWHLVYQISVDWELETELVSELEVELDLKINKNLKKSVKLTNRSAFLTQLGFGGNDVP